MGKNAKDKRPYVKPVKRIEVDGSKNYRPRIILVVGLLALGFTMIFVGLVSLLNKEPGWTKIETDGKEISCAADFVLMYEISGTAESKKVTQVYSQAARDALTLFEDGLDVLNANRNQTVELAGAVYRALEILENAGTRAHYMAPVNEEYNRVFLAESQAEANRYDPNRDGDAAELVDEMMVFLRDPEAVSISLLGGNQARLNVSADFESYLVDNEIDTVVELGWMRNAFAADYIADCLAEAGYTKGYLVSYDGFTRTLDPRNYAQNLFHREGVNVYLPARLNYSGPMSIVSLRAYPMVEEDRWHYYAYDDGFITTAMLDPLTGRSVSAAEELTGCSQSLSCGELLAAMLPVYLRPELDEGALTGVDDASFVWFDGTTLCYSDPDLAITMLEDTKDLTFTSKHVK